MSKLPQLLKPKPTSDEERLVEYVHDLAPEKLRRLLSGRHGERNRKIIDDALAAVHKK
jgi:hypothetical protein